MARDPKIVAISSAEQAIDKFDPNRPSSLPSPLLPVRKLGLEFLKKSLTELFDNADDSLFEMADRAGSNTEQTLFFEAMRAVRLQRHNITKACCMAFMRELESLSQYTPEAPPQSLQNFEIDSLSLVQPDELEETVAIDNMIGRVASRTKPSLSHLSIRLNSLVKVTVDERSNPFGPKMLSQVFVDALAELSLDIKVRLIIYKLFERYVFNQLDGMYEAANRQLISAGVLPDLRGTAQQSATRRAPAASSGGQYAGAPAVESAEHQQVLSMFSELIGNWRHASGDAAISRLGSPSAEPLRSNELLGMLSNLSFNENPAEPVQRIDMRAQINQLLTQHRELSGQARGLERVDDDVISLVSMLFDFILDDPQLPSAVKVLIGRLQLPILRVAIADKRFFSQSSHPARRLLNELARATMGWNDHDDLRRDQLHAMLEGIVERLHGQAEPDPELFASLHTELTGFINVEKRRSERLEQRTRDSEEGKARIEGARNQVAASLNALLLGKTLPVFVIDFLRDTWSQVMQMTNLREGEGSAAWKHAEDTAKRLLDSIEPLADDAYAEREALNTDVRKALAQGLKLVGMRSEQGAPLLMRLKQLQQAIITMPELEPDPQSVPLLTETLSEQADRAEPPLLDVAAEMAESAARAEPEAEVESLPPLESDAPQPESVAAEPAPSVQDQVLAKPVAKEVAPSEPVRSAPVIERVLVDEPVMEAPVPEPAIELVGDLPDAKATEWVAALHTGSWFELSLAEGEPVQRCKLAAIISFSGKYIFVNRTGMKVAEFSTAALGQHFVAGLIRVLDDNQLFDRALESVIGNLRRIQSGKN